MRRTVRVIGHTSVGVETTSILFPSPSIFSFPVRCMHVTCPCFLGVAIPLNMYYAPFQSMGKCISLARFSGKHKTPIRLKLNRAIRLSSMIGRLVIRFCNVFPTLRKAKVPRFSWIRGLIGDAKLDLWRARPCAAGRNGISRVRKFSGPPARWRERAKLKLTTGD